MNYEALNLDEKFSRFSEHWSPRVVAEMNDTQFKLVKVQGEFVWHSHADTDEAFLVVSGALDIEFRDGTVRLKSGEMFVVPRGVEHRPVAREECKLMLVEAKDALFDSLSGNDPVDDDRACLTNTMGSVSGLLLDCGVPPRVE